jgi:glycosyltransferase involved in cell wall biosynthesis
MERESGYIIVPVYNEASVLRQTLSPLLEAGYRLIVVDDGSRDGSADCVAGLPLVLLRHAVNLGQGAALETGMAWARRAGAEWVLHFDADGQHDPAAVERLLEPLRQGRADVTLGSRFLEAASRRAVPPRRRLLLRLAILANALLTGLWLSDAHNGLRALNRHALACLRFSARDETHATEILSEIRRHKLRWAEVPVLVHYTAYSRRKRRSLADGWNIFARLLARKLFS